MNAFITGSYAYGVPRDGSDVDLVILCDEDTSDILRALSDQPSEGSANSQIRFGRLNIIDVNDPEVYAAWVVGTSGLKAHAPVTRETAVGFLRAFERLLDGPDLPNVTPPGDSKGVKAGPWDFGGDLDDLDDLDDLSDCCDATESDLY
jgi:hypothetical protein